MNGRWTDKANIIYADTKEALQLLWDNIVKGQQKQLIKKKEIKELLDRYGVEYN